MNTKSMKNLHLEHPEDLILEGDLSVIHALYSQAHISLKIDGAPAIVFGTNPENGQFFVGTKSVFNKKKIKICYSKSDILRYYEEETHGELIKILIECLLCLPRISNVVQADFIGFGGSNVYKPNTLTYHFPEIVKEQVILAPHTEYIIEDKMCDAVATPLKTPFVDSDDVKWVQPSVDRVFEKRDVPHIIKDSITFCTSKQAVEAKKAINKLIRDRVELNDSNLWDILRCNQLVNLYQLVIELKKEVMDSLIVYGGPKCVLEGSEITGEGYVMYTEYGALKLVDREEFAYANFNYGNFN